LSGYAAWRRSFSNGVFLEYPFMAQFLRLFDFNPVEHYAPAFPFVFRPVRNLRQMRER